MHLTVVGLFPVNEIYKKVSDYRISWAWALNTIPFQLPCQILHAITRYPFPNQPRTDKVFWPFTSNGKFSTSSASLFLDTHRPSDSHHLDFTWIWKHLHTLPKIKYFIWLCSHNRLPAKLFLWKRHIASSSLCHFCYCEESIIHILRDCDHARKLCHSLGSICSVNPNFYTKHSVLHWLPTNFTTKASHSSLPHWSSLFTFACWSLWKYRNLSIFRPQDQSMIAQCLNRNQIYSRTQEFLFFNDMLVPPSKRITAWAVSRGPPPFPFVKLNTDGSSQPNPGKGGIGGVFRNHQGLWLLDFFQNFKWVSSLQAELQAIKTGLALASALGHTHLILESDLTVAVELLKTNQKEKFCR